jgi:hypothetical protein
MNNLVSDRVWETFPVSLTILPTYRCNAACEQCCFESNPKIKGRLSRSELLDSIRSAKDSFPALKLIVFSGGECFLLKQDLFDAIALASELGLMTRCVTNGFWGKSPELAKKTVEKLIESGVHEINISTGSDHQKWVPFASVETAASALVQAGITTLVTVEADSDESDCVKLAMASENFKKLLKEKPSVFRLQKNVWMPFNTKYDSSRRSQSNDAIYKGCDQLFTNMVITPHSKMSSCCGLTFEYIPEMKLGDINEYSLKALASSQLDDFMKVWIAVDGPATIVKRLFPENSESILAKVNHICQACVLMYQNPEIRDAIRQRAHEFAPEIMSRFNLSVVLRSEEIRSMHNVKRPKEQGETSSLCSVN